MKIYQYLGRAAALAAMLFAGHDAALAQGLGVDECGTVVADAACGKVFLGDSGNYYIVANLDAGMDTWSVGARVRVTGILNFACDPFCVAPAACILPGSVQLCGDDTPASYCDGDGGGFTNCTACPCDNDAPAGTNGGCLNGAGTSALLQQSGAPSVNQDTLRFEVSGANADTFGVLASGDNRLPSTPTACPSGSGILSNVLDGLRCVGGNFIRHGARATDAAWLHRSHDGGLGRQRRSAARPDRTGRLRGRSKRATSRSSTGKTRPSAASRVRTRPTPSRSRSCRRSPVTNREERQRAGPRAGSLAFAGRNSANSANARSLSG